MEEHHLRAVPPTEPEADKEASSTSEDGSGGQKEQQKRASRPRASKALPTDRLKLDAQKALLQAIAVASDYGKRAVGSNDIAPRMGLAASTAALNNNFFMESGLIKRESKGKYVPTEAANSFARTYSFNKQGAGADLREVLSNSWYFKEVQQQLAGMGPATKETLIELLAHRASASKDHETQLGSLLAWLEYAQLIVLDGSLYKLAKDVPAGEEAEAASEKDASSKLEKPDDDAPAPAPERTTKGEEGQGDVGSAPPVLSFNFDLSLTADDLKALSPQQIEAVFEAVGKVMAIKTS
jgi:hypothetical protein